MNDKDGSSRILGGKKKIEKNAVSVVGVNEVW
jgi:hypothetical protein